MFLGVIGIAITGTIAARFEPSGLAIAMFAAAAAEVVVALIVMLFRPGAGEPPGLAGVVILTLVFSAGWLLSALLFRRAAVGEKR